MGIPVMILGESGSGKSASLRNFKPDEIAIYNVAGKPLPFKNDFQNIFDNAKYSGITPSLKKNNLNTYVIDDSQYLMAFDSFDRALEKGYDKFTEMAQNIYQLVRFIAEQTTPDTIVYMLHHPEETDTGRIKPKTVGKMVDQHLALEGLFSIVLGTEVDNGNFSFITNSESTNEPYKSPMGMFNERLIENDLKMVDDTIREYWNLSKEIKQEDKGE